MKFMKEFLQVGLVFLGVILIGTVVNYLCIPLYVDWGMLKPAVLTDTIQMKWLLSLMLCEVPWMFVMVGMFGLCIMVMIGFYLWSNIDDAPNYKYNSEK